MPWAFPAIQSGRGYFSKASLRISDSIWIAMRQRYNMEGGCGAGWVVSRVLFLLLHFSERPTRRLWGWSSPATWPCTGGGLPMRRLLPSGFTRTPRGAVWFLWPYPSDDLAAVSSFLRRTAYPQVPGLSSGVCQRRSPLHRSARAWSILIIRNSARRFACSSASDSSG